MKCLLFPIVVLFFLSSLGQAQTTDPAKVAALQARFQAGIALENQGKLKEAREQFLSVVKEEPKARGSLFYIAFTSLRLGEMELAADYINRFREMEPKDFKGLVLAIQINQALKKSVRVETLRKELWELRASGNIPGLTDSASYVRERIEQSGGGVVSVMEFFDYKKDPFLLYEIKVFNAEGTMLRNLVISHDSKQTAELRAKDKKYEAVEMFYFSEFMLKDGQPKEINIYRQEVERPSYESARKWIVEAVAAPPKPLQVAPLQ
jgi:Tfp pilus assembly protein PilF